MSNPYDPVAALRAAKEILETAGSSLNKNEWGWAIVKALEKINPALEEADLLQDAGSWYSEAQLAEIGSR